MIRRMTTGDRVAGAALILGGLVALVTLPVWVAPAVVWMIATGRSLRSCGHEANRMSGIADKEAQPCSSN